MRCVSLICRDVDLNVIISDLQYMFMFMLNAKINTAKQTYVLMIINPMFGIIVM